MCLQEMQYALEQENTNFHPLNLAKIIPSKQASSLLSLYTASSRLESSSTFPNDFTSLHTLASFSLVALTRCVKNGLKGVDLCKETRRYALQLLERDTSNNGMKSVASLIEKTIEMTRQAEGGTVDLAGTAWVELLETWSSIGRRVSLLLTCRWELLIKHHINHPNPAS